MSIFISNIKVKEIEKSGIINRIKQELAITFNLIDMGLISFYLGLKVEKNQQKKTLKLFQLAYINKILAKYHF